MANAVRRMMILKEDVRLVPTEVDGETVYAEQSRLVYLDITGDDNYGKVALSIVKSRFGQPNKRFELAKPVQPAPCSVPRDKWEAAVEPDEDDEEAYNEYMAMKSIVDESTLANRRWMIEVKEYDAIVYCIETDDAKIAPAILEQRRHRPNEGYELVWLLDEYPGC